MLGKVWNIQRVDLLQELDVIFIMKFGEVLRGCNGRSEYCHVVMEVIIED